MSKTLFEACCNVTQHLQSSQIVQKILGPQLSDNYYPS